MEIRELENITNYINRTYEFDASYIKVDNSHCIGYYKDSGY